MADGPAPLTRRARLRRQTLDEIKEHGLAQVTETGPQGLSLNAIARAMGMSGPAIYRYFASRDDLLAALVADSYDDLADAMQAAAEAARRRAPAGRFRALGSAYRTWALAHPHRYRLVFSSPSGSGRLAPEATIPAAHRTMTFTLAALAALAPDAASEHRGALDRQLEAWADDRSGGPSGQPGPSAAVLQLAVLAWTRLHGVVSLEIEGVFASMKLDAALLYEAEVDHLIAQASALAGSPAA